MLQVLRDRLTKCPKSVIPQRQPQFKRAEAPRQLNRFFEERERFDRIGTERARVVSGVRESHTRGIRRAVEQASAIERLIEPLMRIERNRVSQFDAIELVALCYGCQSSIGSVDVKPQSVPLRDPGNFSQRINRA